MKNRRASTENPLITCCYAVLMIGQPDWIMPTEPSGTKKSEITVVEGSRDGRTGDAAIDDGDVVLWGGKASDSRGVVVRWLGG